jgi:hypothetical protein
MKPKGKRLKPMGNEQLRNKEGKPKRQWAKNKRVIGFILFI